MAPSTKVLNSGLVKYLPIPYAIAAIAPLFNNKEDRPPLKNSRILSKKFFSFGASIFVGEVSGRLDFKFVS